MNKSTGNERWSPEGGAWEQMTRSVMGKAHVGFRGKVSGKEFVIIKQVEWVGCEMQMCLYMCVYVCMCVCVKMETFIVELELC